MDSLESRRLLAAAAISFAPHTEISIGSSPVAVVTADFNGDGNADLAVADSSTDTVSFLFGNGAGTFTAGPRTSLSFAPTSMVTGDFDGNGTADIAVAGPSGNGTAVTVFLNNAGNAGTFSAGQTTTITSTDTGATSVALAAGDFNGDGHLDLAATDYAAGTVNILLGNGSGAFATPVAVAVGSDPTSVVSADFNSDGHPDLAVADTVVNSTTSANEQAITFAAGSATGVFTNTATVALSTTGADVLAAGDFNGDGKVDLAYGSADETGGTLLNAGSFAFNTGTNGTTDGSIAGVATADFNDDGDLDAVFANGGISTVTSSGTLLDGVAEVTVGTGGGDGTFTTTGTDATATNPVAVVVGDFNNDGKPDIVTADASSGQVSLLLNTTAVTVLKPTTTTLTSSSTPSTSGTNVTFTATVATTGQGFDTGTPTGTVNFFDGSMLLGSETLSAAGEATFSTAALSVGTHTIKADYTATATDAASNAALSETINAGSNSGPDLIASTIFTSLPSIIVPGESATLRVQVTNTGDELASGTLVDDLYLSPGGNVDSTAAAVAVKGGFARRAIRLAPGASLSLSGTFTVPGNLAAGNYFLVVDVNAGGGIAERSVANNTAASSTSVTLADEFGTVAGRHNLALVLPDAANAAVTYRLSGPGMGSVTTADGVTDLTITGTTAGSTLSVSGAGITLHDLTAAAPLGSVRAPNVSFNGSLGFTAGVNHLVIGNLTGSTLALGGGTVASASLGIVNGTTLTGAGGIAALAVTSWSAGDTLRSAWIGTLTSKGAFGPTVTLSGVAAPGGVALGSARLSGGVSGGIWSVGGNVRSLALGNALPGFSATISGTLRTLSDSGDFAADLAAANFGSVLIRGNLIGGELLAGIGFGADGVPGGGDDTFAAGTITSLHVIGSVTSSLVAAGLDSASDAALPSSDDTLLTGGSIRSIAVGGAVDSASKFLAAALPATVHLGGTAEASADDPSNFTA